ncbi:TPA: phage holin family protein [Morganella morganii]|nr:MULTISPECIES: phage holin family protein [Morganella]MBT0401026.1 phage holin family protein [Morganella morganii subsp. morganii]OFV02210.1 holin [Morganella sp. HMSC11D09]HCR4002930.1 phage holin family protein [Morganella morganii]
MMFEKVLIILNAVICSVIFVRVFSFRRNGRQHCAKGAWIAWIVLSYSANVPVRTAQFFLFDSPYYADITSVISNLLICAAVLVYRGNVMSFFKAG